MDDQPLWQKSDDQLRDVLTSPGETSQRRHLAATLLTNRSMQVSNPQAFNRPTTFRYDEKGKCLDCGGVGGCHSLKCNTLLTQ